MVMAHKSYRDRVIMIESGVTSSLLELTLLGSTLAQKRASRLLEILSVDKGKQVSETFVGGTVANVSAPLCSSVDSKSTDSAKDSEDDRIMSNESKAVKHLVQQSLHSNMRRIAKRATCHKISCRRSTLDHSHLCQLQRVYHFEMMIIKSVAVYIIIRLKLVFEMQLLMFVVVCVLVLEVY
ncbi:hypothetical protein Hdeb2414_s0003g00107691 [Helianthus debilis subsp. tardiflorus]